MATCFRSGGYASQDYPHATFAAMVTRLNGYVGEIAEKVKELGLDDNTLIIFSSDNGPHREGGADPDFFQSSGGFKGIKRDLYEGGIRVPFLARWPGKITAGSQSDFIGAFWDILPTLADLSGDQLDKPIDGLSFVNALFNRDQQQQHPYLYWELHEQGGKQAICYGNWKGVRLNVDKDRNGPIELYDLSVDKKEQHNLASEHGDVVDQISAFMKEAHQESALFPWK